MTSTASGRTDDRIAALFPDPDAPARPTSWWHHKRRVAIAVVIAIIASVVLASRAFGSGGAGFRTATAGRHSVDAALAAAGSIQPVSQATVAFPVSGTVGSVGVKAGDKVTVGQALASLDPQSLLTTLHSKQKTLAQAKLTLTLALSGQSASANRSNTNVSGANSSSSAPNQSNASGQAFRSGGTNTIKLVSVRSTSSDPAIASAQQAVIAAQQAVDAAIATATTAVDNAVTICGAINPADPSTVPPCQTAITDALNAQNQVRTAQNALATASDTLDSLLEQAASKPTPPSTPPSTAPATPRTGNTAAPTGSGGGGGSAKSPTAGGGTSPSAADLAADQQAVDAAAAEVGVAFQALAQATIASPIDGTVVAVNLAVGSSVTASSSAANIVVQGAGGYEVNVTVSVDRVRDVKVGQHVSVVPDGTKRKLNGRVAFISVVPRADPNGTSSSASYLVIVGLETGTAKLKNGATATVAIVTDNAKAALAVPTSAVTTRRNRHRVEVVAGDSTKTVVVTVGAVGSTWTEIKRGLSAGDEVALADLSQALPGSATDSSNVTNGSGPRFGPRNGFPRGTGGSSTARGG